MSETVLLGAGLTGLSVAYHLEKAGYTDYQLFEKEHSSGGLCRSIHQDGFIFDYTGHLLHINDNYFKQFIQDIFGFENLLQIERRSFIYSHGVYTPFPFQMNLYGLPTEVVVECIEGFVKRGMDSTSPTAPLNDGQSATALQNDTKNATTLQNDMQSATALQNNVQIDTSPLALGSQLNNVDVSRDHQNHQSFLEWTKEQFGAGITKHFFKPYQEKIFACDLADITASWTNRFVPQTNLKDMLAGALEPRQPKVGYNSDFYYPKAGGITRWVDALAQKIKNPIQFDFEVQAIDLKNKIVYFKNGEFTKYTTLITTLPLDYLLSILQEPADLFLSKAGTKLRCNSVLNFNLGINKPAVSDKHWVYLPEKQFPQYRLGFYHNLSPAMVPDGCSSVYGEIAYFEHDKNNLDTQLQKALEQTKKLLQINDADIITQKIIAIKRAYVTYDFWREDNIQKIHDTLNSYGIYSVGRYGGWKYNSMQEAVLEGKQVAQMVISRYTKQKCEPFYLKNNHEQKLL